MPASNLYQLSVLNTTSVLVIESTILENLDRNHVYRSASKSVQLHGFLHRLVIVQDNKAMEIIVYELKVQD